VAAKVADNQAVKVGHWQVELAVVAVEQAEKVGL
jgi:hypothetical protein